MFNCGSYTGVTCVDGGCPDALAEERQGQEVSFLKML